MAEVSGNTLVMAIQAVAAEMRRLDVATEDPDESDPNDQLMLLSYHKAAKELEAAYAVAGRKQINLPPYDELAGG